MTYINQSPERCVACHQPFGTRHIVGCRFARFTIRRGQ